ncbi:RHS repeat domain-containing protein [Janthinobacterium sp. P210005]|uniref:RHS repeat domain-containing protein n=1 Tax=Janthinobacterium sp. P210005 TaxID=3112938 RepID=UPI002E270FDA|nr:hypothetical protein [Janthinobacterium sp. P210005]
MLSTRQYDPQSRLTQLTLARGAEASSPLRERCFEYDAQGNLRTILQTGATAIGPLGNLRYAYDPVGQLLFAVQAGLAEHFAFDPAGNLVDMAPATGNFLQRYGDTEYDYDEQGNTTGKRFHPRSRESTWSDLELQSHKEIVPTSSVANGNYAPPKISGAKLCDDTGKLASAGDYKAMHIEIKNGILGK